MTAPADLTALPVRHLFSFHGELAKPGPYIVTGPIGMRVVVAVQGGKATGERINGSFADGVGGDFARIRPDGSLHLDVRLLLQTDDGADIYMTYQGTGTPDGSGGFHLKTAPTFETGDERYAWLNNVQAISLGASNNDGLHYEVYEVL